MSQTFCQGIYTILRDETTPRQDFIFFVDRLATFLVEKAMELLPHKDKLVITPTGAKASGKELDVKVCLCHPSWMSETHSTP